MLVIGNPPDRRVTLLQAALVGLGLPPARVVAYAELLTGAVQLDKVVRPGEVVRIESPGKDSALERMLIAAAAEDLPEPGLAHLTPAALAALPLEPGRILASRQWYRGFMATLERIAAQLALCPPHQLMNRPADIATMFDKPATHARLSAAGVAVPPALGPVRSYAELIETLRAARLGRVFIKLAHGSSASGVVAYQRQDAHQQATTTVEMVETGDEIRLYNSRRIRTYRDPAAIARLI
ncbi:MAG: STM4014 family protein, partial [Herpetosiphonaceae bacterium]|nr:STM4014 family protein [Herpetosiphonaceae bacterium]